MKAAMIKALTLLSLLIVTGCTTESNQDIPAETPALYNGTYCLKWLDGRDSELVLNGSNMEVTMSGAPMGEATDAAIANDLLTASVPFDEMGIDLEFSLLFNPENREEFQGTFTVELFGDTSFGTVVGEKGSCNNTKHDLAVEGLPAIVDNSYIDLASMVQISLFRSSAGHDYADDFESCRSMKHYFVPDAALDWSTLDVQSPVAGEVYSVFYGWAGAEVVIQSADHPGIYFKIFHVTLDADLQVGESVTAGQVIGNHVSNVTTSDIAVHVMTDDGMRLVSVFDLYTSDRLADLGARGVTGRADLIIEEVDRDADPLTCDGETFTSSGSLDQYFDLL